VPEDMPDRMPEDMPDKMPADMPNRMPEDMPDKMPEGMSDRMPEDLPVTKRIDVMVGITRSKVFFQPMRSYIYINIFGDMTHNTWPIRKQFSGINIWPCCVGCRTGRAPRHAHTFRAFLDIFQQVCRESWALNRTFKWIIVYKI
jgi:hypothetical protein